MDGRLTGSHRERYWEVVDIVCFLPPGRSSMFDDPAQLLRLEEHLVWALS